MNTAELCTAVTEARVYLDRFTRHSFVAAFREYTEQFGPLYMQAVRDSGGSETALRAMALMIDWRVALVVWGSFFLLAMLTKYVSLGSLGAGASFPFVSLYVYRDPVIFAVSFLIGAMVVWQHRGNIKRLLGGTESKFKFHKPGEGRP